MTGSLDLWDYRRQVSEMYRTVRDGEQGAATWTDWRKSRDQLFATHTQSPIEDPGSFTPLPFFEYDEAWRVAGRFIPSTAEVSDVPHSGSGVTQFSRIGRVEFEVKGHRASLGVHWLESYAGGVFVPFRDLTNGTSTYGGGRYLLDTAKGADFGHERNKLILDFNYAYHPSCVYSDRWSCPLAPMENRINLHVLAGERLSEGPADP